VAERIASSWGAIEPIARASLFGAGIAAKVFGNGAVRSLLNAARKVISPELLPGWVESVPMPASSKLPPTEAENASAVYFPACINRIFGASKLAHRKMSLPEAFVAVSQRAGYPLFIPRCCW